MTRKQNAVPTPERGNDQKNKKTPLSVKTLEKGLNLLNVLLRDFAGGFTPGELVTQTGLGNSDVTRYVNALVDAGFAERASGGRVHASHSLGRSAVNIMKSLELQKQRAEASLARISTEA